MATLNELGRNSSSITYTNASGADMWPTFSLTDQWIRNDTLQGTATASGSTVTGTGTIFTTQVKAGDSYSIAGQVRTVLAVVSDSSFTVTTAFNFSVTAASAIKRMNTTFQTNLNGTVSTVVRGNTSGTISVTNGTASVVGTGTYFYSDATNSNTLVSLSGTVTVDAGGNITGSGTTFQSATPAGSGIPVTNSLQPGDCIAVTGGSTGTTSGTNIYYLVVATVTSDTAATTVTAPPVAISSGATIQKATNGVAGRQIVINGRVRTVSSIASNTSLTLNTAMDFTDSNIKYKMYPRGVITSTSGYAITGTVSSSSTTLTISSQASTNFPVGSTIIVTAGTGQLTNGTYVTTVASGSVTTLSVNIAPTVALSGATVYAFSPVVTTTTGGFLWDIVDGDNIWTGDENRAYNFNKNLTSVTATAGVNPVITVSSTAGLFAGMTVVITSGGTNSSTLSAGSTIGIVTSATTFTLTGTLTNNLAGASAIQCFSQLSAATTDSTLYSSVVAITYHPPTPYSGAAYTSCPFRREDSYITGTSTLFTQELRVNDEIMINGTECVVQQIISDTSAKLLFDYPQTIANGIISSTGTIGSVAGSGPYTATITNLSSVAGLVIGASITSTPGTGNFGSNNIGSTATVGSITGTGPWTATLTGLTSTAGVTIGASITATGSVGTLYGGSPTQVLVTSIISGTSLTYTVTGGSTPTAGSLTNVLVGQTTIVTAISSLPNGTGASGGGNGVFTVNIISVNTPVAGTVTNITSPGAYIYKKQKIHGYILEGTREGTAAGGKFTTATTSLLAAGSVYAAGSATITLASGSSFIQYGFIKIQGAGGPAVALTGYAGVSATSSFLISGGTTLTGTNTLFTQQLHVGAEIVVGQQYLTVTAIASDTSLTVSQTIIAMVGPLPIYRTTPLYTYIAVNSTPTFTLGTPIKNTVYSNGSNPPAVFTATAATDFLEYVYSAPNSSANGTTNLLFNTSLDRKYFGWRFFPLQQGNANVTTTGGNAITTAGSAYSMTVYERWFASYAQANGAGINLADQSGGTIATVTQSTTSISSVTTLFGTVTTGQYYINGTVTSTVTANSYVVAGTSGTFTSSQSQTLTANTVTFGTGIYLPTQVSSTANFNTDIVGMYQQTGGFIYLFAQPTYIIVQGKSSSNIQSNWIGCVEFERAQPEDVGTGLGTTTGITFTTLAGGNPVSGTPGVSPWPTYGYVNSLRFATGASPIATAPNVNIAPTHGCVISVPRVRESTGDLTGTNAHIYSAFTITTGRWGHLYEFGGSGSYQATNAPVGGILTTNTANTIPQPSMGQLVPVYTNVYNSKRFMFSPVVVLGTAYDPDIRGRLYSLKVIPSNLGTLMDTVSVLVDSNFFYSTTGSATDHWVLTGGTSGSTTGVIQTYIFALGATSITQAWRPLEYTTSQTGNTTALVGNNFRWAIPA